MLGNPELQLEMPRMPTEWWLRPVRRAARVGEQSGVTWKLANRSPPFARASMFGVSKSEPKQLKCEKPRSSINITTMLGALAFGCDGAGHHGTESASVRPIVPSKGSYCFTTPPRQLHLQVRSPPRSSNYNDWIAAVTTSRVGHVDGPRVEMAIEARK